MKRVYQILLLGFIVLGGLASCEGVRFSNEEGVNNNPWAEPESWEQRGTGGPFGGGAGGFPQSR